MIINFNTKCKECKIMYQTNSQVELRELEFCSIECNEDYFDKYGCSLVPLKFKVQFANAFRERIYRSYN